MSDLLSPVLTRRLSNYKIISKRYVRGGQKGERRSQRLGSSLEFSDYRTYNPGDDLRQIDWNTYARSGKFYIKRFLDEQELDITIYLDCTKSMAINNHKWLRAKQMAAVFSFLSLANSDRVMIKPVASSSRSLPFTKGKAMTKKALTFMDQVAVANDSKSFGDCLLHSIKEGKHGGLHIMISDFLDNPEHLFSAIKRMQAKRQQVLLIQVLLPEEKQPGFVGDVKLIDVETMGERQVSMSPKVMENYRQLLQSHMLSISSFCRGRGIDLIPCTTSTALDETVFSTLMGKGWIGR
ncbi:DUF58 domain-containing protein [Aquibacillus kalidii]|uniref:DUF58 domain-containing protein n=1 Tax=Aquibacillus kalidii TaxID=2762597 RepID=UPI0016465CA1|nr:DUF58 domain-containing protein [Aquibacillus kalidii]